MSRVFCTAVLGLVLLILPAIARAGAWLREPGTTFAALTLTLYDSGPDRPLQNTFYAETGVRNWLTLGLDIHSRPYELGHALAFARLPLLTTDKAGRVALELGAGSHHHFEQTNGIYRATLSYGLGFESGLGPGWIAIDLAREHRSGADLTLTKLDLTTGLSADRLINPLLQIESSYTAEGDLYWNAAPSLVLRGKKGTRWQLGIERRSAFPRANGVKLGLWREF